MRSFGNHSSLTPIVLQKKFPLSSQLTRSLLKLMHEIGLRQHHVTSHHDFWVIPSPNVRVQVILHRLRLIAHLLWLVSYLLHQAGHELWGWVTRDLIKGGSGRLVDHYSLKVASVDFWRALGMISHSVVWLSKHLLVVGLGEIGKEVGLLGP